MPDEIDRAPEQMSREDLVAEVRRLRRETARARTRTDLPAAQLDALIECAPFPVYFKDADARFLIANDWFLRCYGAPSRAAVLGKTSEEALGRRGAEYVAEDRIVLAERRVFHREIDLQGRPHAVVKFPILDAEGRLLGLGGVETNITEIKALQDELFEAKTAAELANRSKSAFLAAMSHELRTPLNAIIGFAELLCGAGRTGAASERVEEYAGDILRSGHHLLELIGDILDLSRIEAGRLHIETGAVDASSLTERAIRLVRGQLLPGVALQAELPTERLTLQADERRLFQVLLNVLGNAAKFTGSGAIHVALATRGDAVEWVVRDTGEGVAPEDLARIFEPFRRFTAAAVRRAEGAGLGLWLSKGLVEAHGGRIEVASVLGKGTAVTISLSRTAA
ncbi:MAG: ATP-binding protein [Alphaproteobacteria bacterium]|nr:ATP-binding protein [Alphaproteobacteria bacterium]